MKYDIVKLSVSFTNSSSVGTDILLSEGKKKKKKENLSIKNKAEIQNLIEVKIGSKIA